MIISYLPFIIYHLLRLDRPGGLLPKEISNFLIYRDILYITIFSIYRNILRQKFIFSLYFYYGIIKITKVNGENDKLTEAN